MRVVIVDDEPLARERLKRLLQEFPGYEVVGEADNGESALDVIDDEEPDLVLLDIRMGGIDGLQVGRQLAEMDVPPAVIFTTRIGPDGTARLEGAERAVIRSRAKLAYRTVCDEDLPEGFAELARRVAAAEEHRGAARVDPPQQEVEDEGGHYELRFRPRVLAEERNAALSLATNLAVADALLGARTGLFRVMARPDARADTRSPSIARANFDIPAPRVRPPPNGM